MRGAQIRKLVPGQSMDSRSRLSAATVKCLIEKDGQILLGHEAGDRFPGGKGLGWSLPGGAVEKTESAEMIRRHVESLIIRGQDFGPGPNPFEITETDHKMLACIRECLEEVGLLVTLEAEPSLAQASHGETHTTYLYRAKSFRGRVMLSEDEFREVDAAVWFYPEALPKTREAFRWGWSLYPREELRLRKIYPQKPPTEQHPTIWEEANVKSGELHIRVRNTKNETRTYDFGWTNGSVFGKRPLGMKDDESVQLNNISGTVFMTEDGTPGTPQTVAVQGGRLSLSHDSRSKNFFHVERVQGGVAVLEISAADQGSRMVTFHKITMPEGRESVDPDFRAMILDVWERKIKGVPEKRHPLVSPKTVGSYPNGGAVRISRTGKDATPPVSKRVPMPTIDLELEIPEEVR